VIPYADFLYFGVLLYVVVPTLFLGLVGRAGRAWLLLATAAMLVVQYDRVLAITPQLPVRELWMLAGFALYEWAVARAFLALRTRGHRRWAFSGALLLGAAPLAVAKLVPPLAPQFQFGFIGLSYLSFRALDVTFCIQDRLITALPPRQYLAFLCFFATTSAGPIDRYRRFAGDWQQRRTRAAFLADLDGAVQHVVRGFLYKFICAALIERYWLARVATDDSVAGLLSYMYAYSLHLFFDFAGYSAFAIGVSLLFGVHTPENFDRPFLARNIRDFWNRWHITLSWWLRDHIYMRFVMAALRGRWFASRSVASALGFLLAFGLMGVWHGTAPHYVLYGLYHGALLAGHETFDRWHKRRRLWGEGPLWNAAAVALTFHVVCAGFLLFSGRLSTLGHGRGADATAAVAGEVETVACDVIGGWAWTPGAARERLTLEVIADGRVVGQARADLFRPDLAARGAGDGAHAFAFVPPASLRDGWPHAVEVRAAGSGRSLGAPRRLVCGRTAQSLDGYEGVHDATTCDAITGWARDTTQPEARVAVDVSDGHRPLATIPADGPAGAGAVAGADGHAFRFRVPDALRDGRPHSITVRIAGSNRALAGTPQILTCGAPGNAPAPASAPASVLPPAGGDAAGPPAYTDNGDGTITAHHTRLMWEKQVRLDGAVDAANLHDADNCYPWFGHCRGGDTECRVDADCQAQGGRCEAEDCQTPAPNGMTIFQWVARLNAERFAGHADWRLPTSQELYTIVTPYEEREPATVAAFTGPACGADCADLRDPACSCNHPKLYWAVPSGGPAPDESWMMFFYCNGHLLLDLSRNRFHVRAVRSVR
jgi:membrane protein involved in D-alanine export